MGPGPLLGILAAALAASFVFWIFAAYGSQRLLRFGVCSVCGSVVSVWALNLYFGFLPGWVTLFLMGQSVVGGASLLRDLSLSHLRSKMEMRRFSTVAQLTWFGFILGGTIVLGAVGLVYGWG